MTTGAKSSIDLTCILNEWESEIVDKVLQQDVGKDRIVANKKDIPGMRIAKTAKKKNKKKTQTTLKSYCALIKNNHKILIQSTSTTQDNDQLPQPILIYMTHPPAEFELKETEFWNFGPF